MESYGHCFTNRTWCAYQSPSKRFFAYAHRSGLLLALVRKASFAKSSHYHRVSKQVKVLKTEPYLNGSSTPPDPSYIASWERKKGVRVGGWGDLWNVFLYLPQLMHSRTLSSCDYLHKTGPRNTSLREEKELNIPAFAEVIIQLMVVKGKRDVFFSSTATDKVPWHP